MGGFGAVCGRRGDAGFIGPLLWVCSGVVGFNVAMFLRAVREIRRPARPDVGAGTKKFALRAHNGQKLAFDGALGEFFRGNAAEEAVPGEFVVPCTWQPAHLVAVLTLQCAAKPHWWHGGQPAQDTTYRVNVRIGGPRLSRGGFFWAGWVGFGGGGGPKPFPWGVCAYGSAPPEPGRGATANHNQALCGSVGAKNTIATMIELLSAWYIHE